MKKILIQWSKLEMAPMNIVAQPADSLLINHFNNKTIKVQSFGRVEHDVQN